MKVLTMGITMTNISWQLDKRTALKKLMKYADQIGATEQLLFTLDSMDRCKQDEFAYYALEHMLKNPYDDLDCALMYAERAI